MIYSTACKDWEKRIVGKQSLIAFPPIFQSEADYALGIFKQLKVVDLPGSPTFGESADQWVFDYESWVDTLNPDRYEHPSKWAEFYYEQDWDLEKMNKSLESLKRIAERR